MPGRSSSTPAGRNVPCPGISQPMSHIGRCSIAYDGPPGPVTGSGNQTQSLFGNRLRSVSRSGW